MPSPNSKIDFEALFTAAPALYMALSPEFEIIAVSDAYLIATMTQRNAVVGKNLFDVFPDNPNDLGASGAVNLRTSLKRVLENHATDVMAIQKYDIRRPATEGGEYEVRYWSPVNSPVIGPDGSVRYIIHRAEDVTEYVRLKQEGFEQNKIAEESKSRADTLEKVRQSQRMEAMGQLAGGVAHDFNNLLAVILLTCENLAGGAETVKDLMDGLELIKATSERAAELTRQLLAFSRKQVLQPRPLDLNSVVHNLKSMLPRLIKEDINLKFRLGDKLGTVLADPGQLEQIILNLVVNARDAMPNGGNLTIVTANATLDKGLADGNPRVDPGEYVMIAVQDSGIGMDAATKARLFEPFFTTKGVGKGTGLGLATVYGIVTQNKGTVWVYSEQGQGTTFKIYLPLINETPAPIQKALPFESLGGAESILIAEDQQVLREIICRTLKDKGYDVETTSDGQDALSRVIENPGYFHLVITDVVMPKMGGKDLFKRLSTLKQPPKILFLSGYTDDTLSDYGINGANPYFLEKPFSRAALLSKVRTILSE